MSVTLPEPLANFIQCKVDSGEFASTEEAIGEAVRKWRDQQQTDALHATAAAEGLRDLERGEFSDCDEEELRQLFRTVLATPTTFSVKTLS